MNPKNLSMVILPLILGCATISQEPLVPETRIVGQSIDRVRELVISRAHARGFLPVEGQDLTFDQVVMPSGDPILGIFPGNSGGMNNRLHFTLMQIDAKSTKIFLDPLFVVSPRSNSPKVVPLGNRDDRLKFRILLDDIEREAAGLPQP